MQVTSNQLTTSKFLDRGTTEALSRQGPAPVGGTAFEVQQAQSGAVLRFLKYSYSPFKLQVSWSALIWDARFLAGCTASAAQGVPKTSADLLISCRWKMLATNTR